MEKDGLVLLNFFRDHPDHIARSDQPRLRAAHRPAALQPFAFQPAIDKAEVLAAVINLSVIEPISGPL